MAGIGILTSVKEMISGIFRLFFLRTLMALIPFLMIPDSSVASQSPMARGSTASLLGPNTRDKTPKHFYMKQSSGTLLNPINGNPKSLNNQIEL